MADAGRVGTDAGGVAQPVVKVTGGALGGRRVDGVHVFQGIPFAAPPTGDLRFRPPEPVAPWQGTLDATEPRSKCEQMTFLEEGEEDCLYLNVWTPDLDPADPLPVMVWIHGGGFIFGSGSDAGFDGTVLARDHGVVVVTINYRLHALGFLAHPALGAEDRGRSGNYGLMDQRAALEWVRDNAASFGGDPGNVTIFGESAGGTSVCAHLVSPDSRGLFHRAISQSGMCTDFSALSTLEAAETRGVELAEAVGCTDMGRAAACLRSKTPKELRVAITQSTLPGGVFYGSAMMALSVAPVLDGVVLPEAPDTALGADPAPVPVLLGTNQNEGILFHAPLFMAAPVTTPAQYTEALERRFGDDAAAVEEHYPHDLLGEPNDSIAEVTGDAFFVCPNRTAARLLSSAGRVVYRYTFHRPMDNALVGGPEDVLHAGEIPFVFGDDGWVLGKVPAADEAIAEEIRNYWTRFAATGDPNGGESVTWSSYEASGAAHLMLDKPIEAGADYKKDACDFWDSLLP